MISRFQHLLRRSHTNLRKTEHIYMVLVSIIIGILAGYCAVGFRELIHLIQSVAWQNESYTLEYIYSLPWWWKVFVPAIGGFFVGAIIYYFAREAKGHGVPEVMEAVALNGGRIRPRVVVAKMIASGICIGTGGSVGREGPIVQIGSTIGSSIGQWLGVGERRLRTLVGCGAAAGIAATFNAPVAGALFAVEIILGDFAVTQFSPIVISSVTATVVSRHYLGDFPAFEVPSYVMQNPLELIAYAIMGIMAGFSALGFVNILYWFEDRFDAIKAYPPLKAACGGLVIGIIALWLPHIYGVGYEAINSALRGEMLWYMLLILVGVKILSVSVTIGSGGSGGVFAPALFIGAMVGGAVGTVVHNFWPGSTAGPGAYALVGMGAVVAASTHAPITAILMIFELTNDYKIILPLMVSCIIATLLTTRLQKSSIYTLKLLRRGVDLEAGQSVNVLKNIQVKEVLKADIATISPSETLMPLVSKFIEHPGSTVFVVNENKGLLGIITIDQIRPIMSTLNEMEFIFTAQDIMMEQDYPTLTPDEPLDDVMRILGNYHFETAVIKEGQLIGAVYPETVIQKYNAELFKREMASSLAVKASSSPNMESIPGVKNMSMAEVSVPNGFIGKTLKQLNVRQQFAVTIIMVKRFDQSGSENVTAPLADDPFKAGDKLIAIGTEEKLRQLEHI